MITIATILIEEIDSAVARKSEVTIRWPGFGSIDSGKNSPRVNPHANGTNMPEMEAKNAARRAFLTMARSVSIPVSSRSIRMPSWEMASSIFFWSGTSGNRVWYAAGHRAPSTD
jgi:hypothetical protein